MRLYHYGDEDGSAAPAENKAAGVSHFVKESLTGYLTDQGRDLPETLKSGEPLALRKGSHGKPYFTDPGLDGVFFSLSHTRGHMIVCFSEDEIGVDCENTNARPGIISSGARLAERCFTNDERAFLAIGEPDWHMRFFEIWTAKEAYMKYTGKGFAEGIRSFSVLSTPDVFIETGRLAGAPHVIYSVCTAAGGAGQFA